MNTAPKPSYSIIAKYLGPVFSLDGQLTKNAQNLIFARNGTGKSFLSRAFRYLDLQGQNKDIADAARSLVSDESNDGKGTFVFSRGTNAMGTLTLEKTGDIVTAKVTDTIFHVFSEEFIHEELRERAYKVDDKIENQISIDSENIQRKDAQDALEKAQVNEQAAISAVRDNFNKQKLSELHEKAGINIQLKDYKALSFENLQKHHTKKPEPSEQIFADILKDLDSLKAIPAERNNPDAVESVNSDDIDPQELKKSLQKITSPSSVSEDIKKKIDDHHEFYEAGTKIVQKDQVADCPFCEQGITSADPKAIRPHHKVCA